MVKLFCALVINIIFSLQFIANHALQNCSLQDSDCLTKQARLVLKTLVEGEPAIGTEKLDKMSIGSIDIHKYGLDYVVKNAEVEGLRNAVIEKVSVDLDLQILKVSFETSLTITGPYTASGMLYTIPVHGNGASRMKINHIKIDMLFSYEIVKNKNGYDIMKLKNYIFGFTVVGNTEYRYENLFNGDKEKSDKMHSFLNENWRIIITKYGGFVLTKIMDKIFTNIRLYLALHSLNGLATY